MLKITEQNYDVYRHVFCILWKHMSAKSGIGYDGAGSPIQALVQFELKSKAAAKKSLIMGLSDILTWISHAPMDLKENINNELLLNKLPGLGKLNAELKDVVSKVVKRGRIKNLDEYYLVKEMLDDVDSDISMEDRTKLNELFGAFENRVRKS